LNRSDTLELEEMTLKRICSLVLVGAASGFGATVAEMSGTVFTPEQFASRPQVGIPSPVLLAIAAGMVALFGILRRNDLRPRMDTNRHES
jgi:hypothetical protein